jgi:UDP-N-acetylglucosamine--N-acetylmuramyl-(pentapeptide) pyrophosphoryl-undecaprenol N-acetylglucosamine transferase
MSIVMTGGGTGGHVAIIKAVKEQIHSTKLIYIGSNIGQDKAWFGDDRQFMQKHFMQTRGVVNQGLLGKIKSLWLLAKATTVAYKILKAVDAKVVFCVGGFSAAPTSIAAIIARVPLVIHEQNAALGSLNKILRKYASAFISSYDEKSPIKSYPIKEEFFKTAKARSGAIKTIFFVGGSQGAKSINELATSLAPWLVEHNIAIIHQAGEKNIDLVKASYETLGIKADVFGFTKEMPSIMSKSDMAIARSGASTLWELSANGLPALYIPYPHAASDHQYHNAQFLVEQDMAWIMREDKIDLEVVKKLILDKKEIKSRSQKLLKSIEDDGSTKIASLLESYTTKG